MILFQRGRCDDCEGNHAALVTESVKDLIHRKLLSFRLSHLLSITVIGALVMPLTPRTMRSSYATWSPSWSQIISHDMNLYPSLGNLAFADVNYRWYSMVSIFLKINFWWFTRPTKFWLSWKSFLMLTMCIESSLWTRNSIHKMPKGVLWVDMFCRSLHFNPAMIWGISTPEVTGSHRPNKLPHLICCIHCWCFWKFFTLPKYRHRKRFIRNLQSIKM